jgi:hypothetical protein
MMPLPNHYSQGGRSEVVIIYPDILSHIMSHIVPDTFNLSRSPWHGRHGAPTIRDTGRVGKASCNLSRHGRRARNATLIHSVAKLGLLPWFNQDFRWWWWWWWYLMVKSDNLDIPWYTMIYHDFRGGHDLNLDDGWCGFMFRSVSSAFWRNMDNVIIELESTNIQWK